MVGSPRPGDRRPLSDSPRATTADPPLDEAYDARLVERVRNGEVEAYGELVGRHMRRAFAIAFRILEHREDAEDVVQDAFIRALERIDTLARGRAFHPWLYRIVVNRALNMRRSRSICRTERIPPGTPATVVSPDRSAERAELRRRLKAALDGLPDRQRTIVQLTELEGFSAAEAAEILGISSATARWHLHQARRTLRKALETLKEEE